MILLFQAFREPLKISIEILSSSNTRNTCPEELKFNQTQRSQTLLNSAPAGNWVFYRSKKARQQEKQNAAYAVYIRSPEKQDPMVFDGKILSLLKHHSYFENLLAYYIKAAARDRPSSYHKSKKERIYCYNAVKNFIPEMWIHFYFLVNNQ